jgi:ABC-type sugar transport system permease subunit
MEHDRSSANPLRIILGVLCILPALWLFYATTISPTLEIFTLSQEKLNGLTPPTYIGAANFDKLAQDQLYARASDFTAQLVFRSVAMVAFLPLALALVLNEFRRMIRLPVQLLFSALLGLFVPALTWLSWRLAYNPINGLFRDTHPLNDAHLASAVITDLIGQKTLILACGLGLVVYLIALRGTAKNSLRRVIVPLFVVWFVGILAAIALSLQTFDITYLLTNGGPASSTTTLAMLVYRNSFQNLNLGYAAAMLTPTFLIIIGLGLIAGLVVILASTIGHFRIEMIPIASSSGVSQGIGKIFAGLGILIVGGICLVQCYNLVQPTLWAWSNASSPNSELFPVDQALANSLNTAVPAALITGLVTLVAAFGLGALRPLGRYSHILLIFFSPGLFYTLFLLTLPLFLNLRNLGLLNSPGALIYADLTVNVPTLFILTLLFAGLERQWRRSGEADLRSFVLKVFAPALPLFVFCVLVIVAMNVYDETSGLIIAQNPTLRTLPLLAFLTQAGLSNNYAAQFAFLRQVGFPLFLVTFGLLAIYQLFYFDRLALVPENTENTVVSTLPNDDATLFGPSEAEPR